MRTFLKVLAMIVLAAWPIAGTSTAQQAPTPPNRCFGDVCFPIEAGLDGETALPLRNGDLVRYWGFRVYTAALYAPQEATTTRAVMADVPKRLVIHYHRTIEAKDLQESTEYFMKQDPANDLLALRERLNRLYAAYETVGKGDEYTITYLPGQGTELALNGTPVVTIEGEDFARALFGIWLGPEPLDDDLQEELVYGN